MGKLAIRPKLEEEELDEMLESNLDRDEIKRRVRLVERLLMRYLEDVESSKDLTKSSLRQITDLSNTYLKFMDWLDERPDEPRDVNLVRDFKQFRETLFEFLGADATSLFMQLYTYRFGTTEEKAELEAMTKMGAREAQVERFRNRLIKKWQKTLPRWLS